MYSLRFSIAWLGRHVRNAVTAIALITLIAGCSNAPDSAEKVFNYVNTDEPTHLDPAFSVSVYDGIAGGLIFDGLVNFGQGSEVVPGLAEKWEISEDGKSYTFHLRDARFSDGTTVTAADVSHSIHRILRPETVSDRKWLFDAVVGADEVTSGIAKTVTGIETPDDRTVIIRLKRAYPAFLTKLAMPNAVIVPVKASGEEKPNPQFDKKPVGSGPWVLDRWTHDLRLEFVPNPHFWGPKPKLHRFNYNVQDNDSLHRQQFKIGKLDIYPRIGFVVLHEWSKDPQYKDRIINSPEINTYFLGFTHKRPALQDKRVRQAIAHGINTREIYDRIQLGRGALAHGPVPHRVEGYRPELRPHEYNPEKAKQLLKEAGVEGLQLSLWLRTEAQSDEVAAAVQAHLAKIGVKVAINKRDQSAMLEATNNGQPDIFLWSWWLDYPDIENALRPCFHSSNGPRQGNRAHYGNPEVDRLLDAAAVEGDAAKRIELFQKAEDVIIADVAWVPLYHRESASIVQPWVTGYRPALMYNAARYLETDIDLTKKKGD